MGTPRRETFGIASQVGRFTGTARKLVNKTLLALLMVRSTITTGSHGKLSPIGLRITVRPRSTKQWNFYGKQREKMLAATASFVFLQYKRYVTYENLQADYASVIAAIENSFPDARARRFGLRYINHIEIEGLSPVADWGEYIDKDLVATISFYRERQLTRLLQLAELKEGELDVRFQFGMPNPDYPAVMRRPFFVLDLDAYIQTAHELKETLQYIENAHSCIQDLFEKSITDKLRKRMHVKLPTSIRR